MLRFAVLNVQTMLRALCTFVFFVLPAIRQVSSVAFEVERIALNAAVCIDVRTWNQTTTITAFTRDLNVFATVTCIHHNYNVS